MNVVEVVLVSVLALTAGIAIGAAVTWTARRAWMRQVRDAERRAAAAERLAEIGSMTGGLAHEIKNPLSTIGLNAQLLQEGVEDLDIPEDEQGRLVRRVGALRREADRLRDVLAEFLEFAGELHLEPREVDLNEVLGELLDFFHPQADALGVRVRSQFAPGPLRAMLDPAPFKQAALNLLLNGVQAMERTEGERELIVRTETDVDGEGRAVARLRLADTGPGMDAETRSKIFHPYFTTKPGGSGLGLPMTRRIIESHGGEIETRSEPGRGTEFTITVPAASGSG